MTAVEAMYTVAVAGVLLIAINLSASWFLHKKDDN